MCFQAHQQQNFSQLEDLTGNEQSWPDWHRLSRFCFVFERTSFVFFIFATSTCYKKRKNRDADENEVRAVIQSARYLRGKERIVFLSPSCQHSSCEARSNYDICWTAGHPNQTNNLSGAILWLSTAGGFFNPHAAIYPDVIRWRVKSGWLLTRETCFVACGDLTEFSRDLRRGFEFIIISIFFSSVP
jgi:hypothetical protein